MLKIGVLGAGHLGKIHIKLLQEIPEYDLIGFYDPDDENARKTVEKYGVNRFESMDALMEEVDAIDIVTPTLSHFECAEQAIRKSKHIFIEKPLTSNLEEAKKLVSLVEEANIKAQVGHVERFNPAFLALEGRDLSPLFIETHRLSLFNPRGTDVSVILDLMIHDIDIILKLVNANVMKISASGVPIISDSPDIANARIEFDNGAVANITASRISLKNMRKMRIFQHDAYISMDFLKKKTEIVKITGTKPTDIEQAIELDTPDDKKKYLYFESPEAAPVNSIKMELELFYQSIVNNTDTPVTVLDGFNAMKVAYQILHKINKNNMA